MGKIQAVGISVSGRTSVQLCASLYVNIDTGSLPGIPYRDHRLVKSYPWTQRGGVGGDHIDQLEMLPNM